MRKTARSRGKTNEVQASYEIIGEGDAHALEALCLEIRRLAKRHGVIVEELRVEPVRGSGPSVNLGPSRDRPTSACPSP